MYVRVENFCCLDRGFRYNYVLTYVTAEGDPNRCALGEKKKACRSENVYLQRAHKTQKVLIFL